MGMMNDNIHRKSVTFVEILDKLLKEGKEIEIVMTEPKKLEIEINDDSECKLGISEDPTLDSVEGMSFSLVDAIKNALLDN